MTAIRGHVRRLHAEGKTSRQISAGLAELGFSVSISNVYRYTIKLGLRPHPHKRVYKLSPYREPIRELNAKGLTNKEIAAELDLRHAQVTRLVALMRLVPNFKHPYYYQDVGKLYLAGVPVVAIAERFGITPSWATHIRRKLGIPPRTHIRYHTPEELADMKQLIDRGRSFGECARILSSRWGMKVTRNVIAGVASRRGWRNRGATRGNRRTVADSWARQPGAEDSFHSAAPGRAEEVSEI